MSAHVVTVLPEPHPIAGTSLVVHCVPLAKDNLGWLLADGDTGRAAVVDGPEAGPVLDACERLGLTLEAVINTHTHWDHIGVNKDLAKRGLLSALRVIGPARAADAVPGLTEPVCEGATFTFGGATFRTWLTEGHLDGHVSYLVGDALFCGDTLFAAGCGYLFSGPPAKMHASLQRFAALPGQTRVFCAHEYTLDNLAFAHSVEATNPALAERVTRTRERRAGGHTVIPSTIADELATNPFIRMDSPEILASLRRALPDADLSSAEAAFAATRTLKNLKRYEAI